MSLPTDAQIIARLKKQGRAPGWIQSYLRKWHETGERLARQRRAKQ